MRKLCILLIPLLLLNIIFAEMHETMSWKERSQLGLKVNGNYYLASLDDKDAEGLLSPGFGGFFDYKLSNYFALNLGLEYNQVNMEYPTYQLDNSIITATLKGKFFMYRSKSFNPYIDLGFGLFSFTQENGYTADRLNSLMAIGGLGAEIALSNRINIIPAVNITTTINEDFDALPNEDHLIDDQYLSPSLGISFKLGGPEKEKPEPEVEEEVEKPEEVMEPAEPDTMEEEEELVEEEPEELEETTMEEVEKQYYEKLQYMIKPNDYLIKIANNIYEDKSMWQDIYSWNRDMIGDNPNLIYPFHELLLRQVPVENINKLDYEYYNYEVGQNESLWKIAAKEYGNPYAWIVIYKDNKNILGERAQNIEPGTVLKLRSELFNK